MKVTIELNKAAKFIAELVRQGVTFDARQCGELVVIEFTGGF